MDFRWFRWNFAIDKEIMSRIVPVCPDMPLLELQNNVVNEYFLVRMRYLFCFWVISLLIPESLQLDLPHNRLYWGWLRKSWKSNNAYDDYRVHLGLCTCGYIIFVYMWIRNSGAHTYIVVFCFFFLYMFWDEWLHRFQGFFNLLLYTTRIYVDETEKEFKLRNAPMMHFVYM